MTHKERDKLVVLGASVFEPHPEGVVHGSTIILADCGHRAWLSPSGLRALRKHDLETCCMRCVATNIDIRKAEKRILAGSRDELNRKFGVGYTDQLFSELYDDGFRVDGNLG